VKKWGLLALAWTLAHRAHALDCTPGNIRTALVQDPPATLSRVADVPQPVLDALWRLGAEDPARAMADPNQPFQATDVIRDGPSLPWRRLIAAGASSSVAFVAYEKGGIGKSEHLFVVCLAGGKVVGAYTGLRLPATFDVDHLVDALHDGCLVSPPREFARDNDATRCPAGR
jgi:hypothetical protein